MKEKLIQLKRKLIRYHLYNTALTGVERGIVHLVLKLDVKLVGNAIVAAVKGIIEKAQACLRPTKYQIAMQLGEAQAEVNVNIALHWGLDAMAWLKDRNYLLLLGLNLLFSGWRGVRGG